MKNWLKNIGPGPLVAAAFIGPGTVTACTLAGAEFGLALLWAMVLSTIATIVLQEMSARIGIVSQKGLAEIIRTQIKSPVLKWGSVVLVLSAIVIGNAAYEAGNISGGVLGLEAIFGSPYLEFQRFNINYLALTMGLIAFILLYIGNYKILERVLIGFVILMSLAFIITAFITKPVIAEVFKGLFIPRIPEDGLLTILALIGTTVVPYNLFLHASLVSEKWKSVKDLKYARKDTYIAVILGGFVSICIIVAATAISSSEVNNASDLAKGLEPLFGKGAKYFLGIGLFSAGITSAITAPLAAAFVAAGCFGWSSNLKSKPFRAVWMFILFVGIVFSSLGIKSIEIIKFAQVANGLLLPIIAGYLLWLMNQGSILKEYKNTLFQNIIGLVIVLMSVFLGIKSIFKVFEII